jgi:hypothetical protein
MKSFGRTYEIRVRSSCNRIPEVYDFRDEVTPGFKFKVRGFYTTVLVSSEKSISKYF